MKTLMISRASRDLLAAHAAFRMVGAKAVGDRFEIEVDDDVAAGLFRLDEDVDKAIAFATQGVGRSVQ